MPLDKNALKNAIKTTFENARNNNWTPTQVATSLADAIDAFVKSGDVKQVTVEVKNDAGNKIGTGTQTGVGKVQ